MHLVVNKSQLSKFKHGKPFQLSKDQVQGNYSGGALFEIEIPDEIEKTISKARRNVRGVRLVHHGGSITSAFKSIGNSIKSTANKAVNSVSKSAKKTGRVLESGLKTTGDAIVDTAKTVNRMALKADLGGYVEKVKDVVPQSALTTILTTALTAGAVASGQPELIPLAGVLANSASTAFYKADFSRSLNGQGEAVGKAAALSGAKAGVQAGVKSANASNKKQTNGGSLNPFIVDPENREPGLIPRRKTKGGSFRPVGEHEGDGFKPSGSGFKPSGSGFKKPTKGSPEAKEWAMKMKEARERKRF